METMEVRCKTAVLGAQVHSASPLLITLVLVLVLILPSFAQFEEFNHPELVWRTIETDHFAVHYHDGAERTARELAGIAEAVYTPITDLYGYHPDGKVHWIVRDHDDYSNGGTYYYDNKIVIWATPLDFELRGTHHWLYDVVTHEFTHMIQLGASRKGPRWLPGVYFQFIGYEPERRPDVLYGYPNRIASWPVSSTVIPMWFAEGTAQFQARGLGHDWWDSHRDMMIRVRALSGNLLTLNQMEVFGKNTLGSELVYCQGYALTRFIADSFGDRALADLSAAMRGVASWDFDRAFRRVLGISESQLYDSWRRQMEEDYRRRTELIRANEVSGKVIQGDGFGNLYPAFSPDGRRLAFVSNKGKDFLSMARVYIYDVGRDSLIRTDCPAAGPLSWSPDGRILAYDRQESPDRKGSHFDDLFLWEIEKKREIRLTRSARLASPSFSGDGKQLIAVHTADGSQNLALVELPDNLGKTDDLSARVIWKKLTDFSDGRQIFKPRFAPDGKTILCATADLGTRDIARYRFEDGRWDALIATDYDERDPTFSTDGRRLYYAGDRTGVFNLYRRDLITLRDEALTNVVGGAFMPAVSDSGNVAYIEFTEKGYGVRLLREPAAVDPAVTTYFGGEKREDLKLPVPPRSDRSAKLYATPFGKMFVLPRVAWDYGRFKPGFYAYTNDFLERLSLFGGASLNGDGDRDLYIRAEYRVLRPTLFLEAYNIVRRKSERFDDPFVIVGEKLVDSVAVPIYGQYAVDYRFNLTELDLGLAAALTDAYTTSGIVRISTYKSSLRFDDGGSFDYTYMKGRAYILRMDGNQIARSAAMDIHPTGGWKGWFEYARENNGFLEGFEIDKDKLTLLEVFKPNNYHRVEAELDYYRKLLGDVVLNPRLMGGALSKSVDPFFHLYAGGLPGLRGYSFYSLGGTAKAAGRLCLRFPIATGLDRRWGPFYLDRVHGALFAEAGDAWRGGPKAARLRKDVGGELRVKLFSWYGFPTDLALVGAYGLDRFTVTEGDIRQTNGREWRWYMTLLFDFL